MSAVKLSDHSDFITPALACVKPMQIDKAKPNRVLHLEDLQDGSETAAPAVAKVTLNDCLACAGCITSAESVLVSQQSIGEFRRMLSGAGSRYDLFIVSISGAARAAIATHIGLDLCETHGRLTGFLKGLGCHSVLDCGVAANIGLLQQAAEFIDRFRAAQVATQSSPSTTPLPLLSSSCPGWVCYAEKMCGAGILRHLSRVKSPQQIAGTLVKYVHAAARSVPPERVCHVSIMPCFDKKLEASRDDFFNSAAGPHGSRDVDCVLSSAELLQMATESGLESVGAAPLAPPDDGQLSSLVPAADGGFALAYATAGASGGHADFIFRAAARELFGVEMAADAPLPWVAGRNADIAELTLTHQGEPVLRFCRAYGFRNIQNLVRRVKSGRSSYHYVELMACPSGCANGGGQPRPPALESSSRPARVEARYVEAEQACLRPPENDPAVAALYADGAFLQGGPRGKTAQQAMLTDFRPVDASAQNPLTIQW